MPLRKLLMLLGFIVSFLFAGCSADPVGTPVRTPAPTSPGIGATASAETPTAVATALPSQTPTPAALVAVLLVPPGSQPAIAGPAREALEDFSAQSGWSLVEHPDFGALDAAANIQLIVVLPGVPGLAEQIAARPETPFLAIGFAGLEGAPNLAKIGPTGPRPDQQAFLAGYLAAIATEDWRVAVLAEAGTPGGSDHRVGFLNGTRYFCGLCRPTVPPFAAYPLFDEIPAGADETTQQAAADRLLAEGVRTVYLQPEIETAFLQSYLADSGVFLIGTRLLAPDAEDQWLASVLPAPEAAMQSMLPDLIAHTGTAEEPLSYRIEPGPASVLSPGRLALARKVIPELLGGFIDTGVNPAFGTGN